MDWRVAIEEPAEGGNRTTWTQCGALQALRAIGEDGVFPYACRIDYLMANLMGLQLVRTKTLADGDDCCNNYIAGPGSQLAEVVPEKYRKIAICTESQRFELSRQQRQAAEQRTVEDRNRAKKAAHEPPVGQASGSLRRPSAASQPSAKRPTEVVIDATDCPTWWRIYDESVECFGPYRTTRGATKVAGSTSATSSPVPSPSAAPEATDVMPAKAS